MKDKCEIVYVLINEAFPTLIKIGKTKRKDIKARMDELYSTGVPLPFECLWAGEVSDCQKIENILHNAFRHNRINPKREFFEIEPDQVIPILQELSTKEITSQIAAVLNKDVSKVEKEAVKVYQNRRPVLNFDEMGIANGEELVFVKDNEIKAVVIEPKKIYYNNKEYSLSGLTKELFNIPYYLSPCKYWTHNGKNLDDIYEETYPYTEY